VAIDFDSITDRIFWSDTTQDKIWSAYQNGTDRKIVSFTKLFFSFLWRENEDTVSPVNKGQEGNPNRVRREIT